MPDTTKPLPYVMAPKLLSDEELRKDIDIELSFMSGTLAATRFTGPPSADVIRDLVREQLNLLMPTIRRHIKRRVKQAKYEVTGLVGEQPLAKNSTANKPQGPTTTSGGDKNG